MNHTAEEFQQALNDFLAYARERCKFYQSPGYSIEIEIKEKFAQLIGYHPNPGSDKPSGSYIGHVCLFDGENKTLGKWEQGDIKFPGAYGRPAKGPNRGNIFKPEDRALWFGDHGVRYLR